MPSLDARFDLDNNVTLDMQEWMLACSAARREEENLQCEAQNQPEINISANRVTENYSCE